MRTIVLTCTSEFLSNSYADRIFKNDDYYRIPYWTVHQPDGIVQDVIFYMLRIGKKDKEIVMKGRFRSAPNPDLYWRGNGPRRYWVELLVEQLIHPVIGPTLGKDQLAAAIPTVNWNDSPFEMILAEDESEKLEQLWNQHVELHATDFRNPKKVRYIREEYEMMGIGERARKKIIGVEKLDYFFGENGMCFHDAVVTKFDYDRKKRELNVLIDTYCRTWSPDGETVYLIPLCFKDVYDFNMDIEPGNDYIHGATIYSIGNGIRAYFESAHMEVYSPELEIGEIVEIKCGDEEKGNKFKF
jgi:hypothetical protein